MPGDRRSTSYFMENQVAEEVAGQEIDGRKHLVGEDLKLIVRLWKR